MTVTNRITCDACGKVQDMRWMSRRLDNSSGRWEQYLVAGEWRHTCSTDCAVAFMRRDCPLIPDFNQSGA